MRHSNIDISKCLFCKSKLTYNGLYLKRHIYGCAGDCNKIRSYEVGCATDGLNIGISYYINKEDINDFRRYVYFEYGVKEIPYILLYVNGRMRSALNNFKYHKLPLTFEDFELVLKYQNF